MLPLVNNLLKSDLRLPAPLPHIIANAFAKAAIHGIAKRFVFWRPNLSIINKDQLAAK